MRLYSEEKHTQVVGSEGENIAVAWLVHHGYTVCARNYRNRWGEIDIIAQKNEIIAFVEVKRRINHYFGLSDVITKTKQYKIGRVARAYCALHENLSFAYRFDVALVEGEGNTLRVTYIENAFTVETEL